MEIRTCEQYVLDELFDAQRKLDAQTDMVEKLQCVVDEQREKMYLVARQRDGLRDRVEILEASLKSEMIETGKLREIIEANKLEVDDE